MEGINNNNESVNSQEEMIQVWRIQGDSQVGYRLLDGEMTQSEIKENELIGDTIFFSGEEAYKKLQELKEQPPEEMMTDGM